uniref:Putative secreted protein n=1 Tax=Ixodes ricinus TaxID=34613 RepID=A0A6B0U743_IXORI
MVPKSSMFSCVHIFILKSLWLKKSHAVAWHMMSRSVGLVITDLFQKVSVMFGNPMLTKKSSAAFHILCTVQFCLTSSSDTSNGDPLLRFA